MLYLTTLNPKRERYHIRVQSGGRGLYFNDFEYELRNDPTAEGIAVAFGLDLQRYLPRELWPDVEIGALQGAKEARAHGLRLCCVRFTMLFAKYHEVDTTPRAVQNRIADCIDADVAIRHSDPVPSLHRDWLTSDVVALARGVQADVAFDRLPILADALQDAGCDHPLLLEHLRTCPDHAPSCWVVEMVLDQAAARDTGAASS